MTDNPLTISVPEAAKRLGIGRDTAYEAARQGKIPTIRFGRIIRVPLRALDQMLEQPDRSAGSRAGA